CFSILWLVTLFFSFLEVFKSSKLVISFLGYGFDIDFNFLVILLSNGKTYLIFDLPIITSASGSMFCFIQSIPDLPYFLFMLLLCVSFPFSMMPRSFAYSPI